MRFLSVFWQALVRLGIARETRIDRYSRLIRIGRDEYRYVEGERTLTLQIDMLKGRPSKLIYPSSIDRWLPPHEDKPITDLDRKRIAQKIADFMRKQGISVAIDDSE
ncbi:MAG: Imm74 family immunity protein [Acidobacteriota bacterium]